MAVQPLRSDERILLSAEPGTEKSERGTGNAEVGTGNAEVGTGNGERGTKSASHAENAKACLRCILTGRVPRLYACVACAARLPSLELGTEKSERGAWNDLQMQNSEQESFLTQRPVRW